MPLLSVISGCYYVPQISLLNQRRIEVITEKCKSRKQTQNPSMAANSSSCQHSAVVSNSRSASSYTVMNTNNKLSKPSLHIAACKVLALSSAVAIAEKKNSI